MRNPLARFFARKTSDGRSNISTLFTARTPSAVTVSNEQALYSDAAHAAIRYLAQTVGQLPWYAYKPKPGAKGADILTTSQFDEVNNVLSGRCNPNMSAQRFREIMVMHAVLYGNGVAEIERGGSGRAKGLYICNPEKLQYETGDDGETLYFVYDDERRGKQRLEQRDVFHIAAFGAYNDKPAVGKSVIEYAAASIGWQKATELFGAAYFGNGVHPSGMITMKNALSPEAYKVFQEELKRKFGGSQGAHQPFVTDGEATFTKFGIQADEAQFIQSMQHQVEQIARWIGVPPSKIGHLLHAGVRANVEHASIEVVQDHIMPWALRFEAEANAKVFRDGERYFTRMDFSALLRGDNQARAEYISKMLDKGVISVNEARDYEGYNPIGPEGDQHLVQGQYMPLADVGLAARSNTGAIEKQTPELPQAPRPEPVKQIAPPITAEVVDEGEEWGGVVRTLTKASEPSKLDDVLVRLAERLA